MTSDLDRYWSDDPEGYHAPYAQFLEQLLDEIEQILQRLILEHGEHKPIEAVIAEIEQWLGDDWYIALSEADRERLDAIKGWRYD